MDGDRGHPSRRPSYSLRFIIRATLEPSRTDPFVPELPVPRLTFLVERQIQSETLMRVMQVDRPLHLILLPRDLLDPDRPYRRLLDIVRHQSIDDVIARLAT